MKDFIKIIYAIIIVIPLAFVVPILVIIATIFNIFAIPFGMKMHLSIKDVE